MLLGSRLGDRTDGRSEEPVGQASLVREPLDEDGLPTARSVVGGPRPTGTIGRTTGPGPPVQQSSPQTRRHTPIVAAANQVAPSVVNITVMRAARRTPRSMWDDLLGPGASPARVQRAYGSGFAIDTDGFLLTNEHVVRGADSIVVTDAQGRVLIADLVGADDLTDIAVLRIEGGRVPPASLGTSSDLVVGEPAIAIGNPFGYLLANAEATVTAGVISGVGRDIRSEDDRRTLLADMVQTDASINPGNSGGPLVNADGEVIGVNSSIFSRSGGSEGLGFAIPIDRALRIADELRRYGRIRRPFVGVDPMAVESDTVLFVETIVRRVAPDSPAERAGLRTGDVLIAVDGRRIASPVDWEVGLLDAGVAAAVEVTYSRGGEARNVRLVVEELPSESAERLQVLTGLELITVDAQIAVERRLPLDQGAMIADISPRNAAITGMRAGDVIVAVGRQRVSNAEDVDDLFQYYAGRGRIRVSVFRDGSHYSTYFGVQ
jgi:serine protease Do